MRRLSSAIWLQWRQGCHGCRPGTLGTCAPRTPAPKGAAGWKRSPGPPPAHGIVLNCSPLISLRSLSETQAERHVAPLPTAGISKNLPRKPPGAIFPLSPRYQAGRSWSRAGQVPRACGAMQEAEISTGRSGKLTVSQPFASVLNLSGFL